MAELTKRYHKMLQDKDLPIRNEEEKDTNINPTPVDRQTRLLDVSNTIPEAQKFNPQLQYTQT